MPPATILLMRHADKTGEPGDRGLSPEGEERARRLAQWLPKTFGAPDVLVAAADSPKSRRSTLTLEPLARTSGLRIEDGIRNDDFQVLAARLLSDPVYAGKLVVVCWHQGKLPKLAKALGAPEGSYPEKWGKQVYDRVLRLEFDGGARPRVTEIKQPF